MHSENLRFFSAYQNNDINEFERILKSNKASIMDDPFIREHIEGKSLCISRDSRS